MTPIRTLIVDDEPLARVALQTLLASEERLELVGEADCGDAAVEAVRRARPQLLLLDVSLPDMDGFEVLRRLGDEAPPHTIFVTAHGDHALRAFDVDAIDYLMKPVSRKRLAVALDRAHERLATSAAAESIEDRGEGAGPSRLAVRTAGRMRYVPTESIDWIEAADYCVRLHAAGTRYLIRRSMKSLERLLSGRGFVRVHRSAIVNADRVREIRSRRTVVLDDGTELPISRSRSRTVAEALAGSSAV